VESNENHLAIDPLHILLLYHLSALERNSNAILHSSKNNKNDKNKQMHELTASRTKKGSWVIITQGENKKIVL
jgi:hypothetical protein